jgi:hypothetical protein
VAVLETGRRIDDIEHPNQEKYPHQRMFVVMVNDDIYGVPYVENDDEIFLKTAFQSCVLKHLYLPDDTNDKQT